MAAPDIDPRAFLAELLEPGVYEACGDDFAPGVSIAISLKRLADHMDAVVQHPDTYHQLGAVRVSPR